MHVTAVVTEHEGYANIRVTDERGRIVIERGALTAVVALTRVLTEMEAPDDGKPFTMDVIGTYGGERAL
jgi:hypothetical protein